MTSIEQFKAGGGNVDEWLGTEEAKSLNNELQILKLKERKFREQMQRLAAGDATESITLAQRRSYLQLFLSSKRGLDLVSGAGKRDSRDQSNFRQALINAYNATNPDGWEDLLWCPVLSKWLPREYVTASHIFSYKRGQNTMDAIFGQCEEPELFSPKNGLLISKNVEAKFESGLFVIVPDLPEEPTAEMITRWQQDEPREYKLKIIERDSAKLNRPVVDLNITWKELDGKRLEFRNNFRPRSRYLYYHYCLQILRLAYTERFKGEIIRETKLEKPFWGSPGKYVKRNMLLAFVEEVGHKYHEQLLQGAAETGDREVKEEDDLLLLAATRQMDLSRKRQELDGIDIDDEDDEDDEDL
ncbi:hypothetical protein PHISCL_06769 [Aspergillus sclerotialis]|uniref:HNH nuclease domain-containing protein n=1 Tax=Aspergillus sclerotialis TaxID=2070753 RepID=A0A3A2ZV47_9EURO|nr:hypothetical protein PHISCL_06769 [Aspergillus sclerotialis]